MQKIMRKDGVNVDDEDSVVGCSAHNNDSYWVSCQQYSIQIACIKVYCSLHSREWHYGTVIVVDTLDTVW